VSQDIIEVKDKTEQEKQAAIEDFFEEAAWGKQSEKQKVRTAKDFLARKAQNAKGGAGGAQSASRPAAAANRSRPLSAAFTGLPPMHAKTASTVSDMDFASPPLRKSPSVVSAAKKLNSPAPLTDDAKAAALKAAGRVKEARLKKTESSVARKK